ncbi:MAG: oligosaccharide flippase family protein [Anaerolineae bacterium]|nr:oligosaccharide flippase family protein [Anaerolineae bacterium]
MFGTNAISIKKLKWLLRHPLVSNGGLLAIAQYIATGLNLVTTIIAAQSLGPGEYGIVALAIAYPTLLWSFVGVKSVSITTRYIAGFRVTKESEKLKAMCKLGYGLDFILSLVAFVLVSATAWWIARFVYDIPSLSLLMITYAASFPFFSLTGTSWAILSSWQRFRWLSVFQVIDPAITLILILGFLLAGFRITGVVIATALGHTIIGIAMMFTATYMLYREGFGFWWDASLIDIAQLRKELVSFTGWNYLMVTLSGLMGQVPLMLLGYFRGPEEAGFYRLATSIVMAGSYLETSLGKVVYPVLSARWKAMEKENIKRTLRRWTFLGGVPLSLLLLLVIPFLPILIQMVFGQKYRPIVLGVQLMMIGTAISALFFWLTAFYYATGKIAMWAKGYSTYAIATIGVAWFVVQQWGFLGITTAISIGKVVFILLMLFWARQLYGFDKTSMTHIARLAENPVPKIKN